MREAVWSVGGTGEAPGAAADAALVAAAKTDPQAFGPLYDRYADKVYRYCLLRLRDRPAAEDATAQVFLKALAALPACRGDRFAGWLFAIARAVVADAHRRRSAESPLAAADLLADRAPLPDEQTLADEAAGELLARLAGLPEAQRRVVELRLAGLTGRQTAAALGKNLGAVKMLQLRAVRSLRRRAAQAEGSDR